MRFILFFILFTALCSCQSQQEQLVIPADKLLKVLEDVHIAEAAMTGLAQARKDSIAKVYYEQIYAIHGITAEDFNHDLELLKSRPEQLAKAYGILVKKLEEKQ